VRQLRRAVEGACALVPEGALIEAEHLRMIFPQREEGAAQRFEDADSPRAAGDRPVPGDLAGAPPGGPASESAAIARPRRRGESEKELLREILERHGWNVTHAAGALGITRQHLYNRIRLYKLQRPPGEGN
jgi:DNA-binding NtrC family response regulator